MRLREISVFAIIVTLFMSVSLRAQNYQGNLRGLVTDSSGAIVPAAKVVLTDEGKKTVRDTVSNQDGQYVFPSLEPGNYTVEIKMAGFKNYIMTGIVIGAEASVTQDLRLDVGAASETVEVHSSEVSVDLSDASLATSFVPDQINDMATLSGPGRSPFTASQLAPTITPNAGQNSGSSDQSNISYVTVAGSPEATNLYLVDGIPITDTTNRPSYVPPIEAIQEQKVQILSYDAEMSRTGGGVFNTVLKSGTNRVHGSLYGVTDQTTWNANSFFGKRNGQARPPIKFYNYAGSLGGPVVIPHIYDGRDRTFLFVAEEGYRNPTDVTGTYTVPTAAERTGDFSAINPATGTYYTTIYDPATTVISGGVVTRTPFQGNKIPQSRLNQIGLNYLNYYPLPNVVTATGADANNYIAPLAPGAFQRDDVFVSKLDHQFFPWLHSAGSYTHYGSAQVVFLGAALSPIASGGSLYARKVDSTTFNTVITPNNKTVVSVRFGFNRFPQNVFALSHQANFSPTTLGFPNYNYQSNFFPQAAISNYTTLGTAVGTSTVWSSRNFAASINESLGRHSVKGGLEFRRLHVDYTDLTDAPSDYSFNGVFTTAKATAASGTNGNATADVLLGLPISGQIEQSQKFFQYLSYYGLFVQDDFRVNHKLTLNLGLRYEYETGLKEKNNNEVVGFDQTIASPLAAYDPGVVGGLLYAGLNTKTECCDLSKKKFAPKLGFAYELTPKTVIHGGIGMLYLPMRYDPTAALNIGYTSETPIVSSTNGGETVSSSWSFSNPFPSGPIAPTGNSAGLLSGIGTPIQAIQLGFKSPLITQFSIGVQRTLPWGVLFEGSYIGSRGRHLPTTPQGAGTSTAGGGKTNIDQLNPTYYSMGTAALSTAVANPFYGHGGVGTIGGATVSQAQLLLPFPQFTSVNLIPDYAGSSYNGMAIQVTKRSAKKFDLSANFTWSRNEDDEYGLGSVGPQNVYNLPGEWSQSALDLPFRYTANGDYWLPVGRGRALLGHVNRWVDLAVGGWQVDVTNVIQSGLTLGVTQSNQNSLIGTNIQRPNLNPGVAIKTTGSKFSRITDYVNSSAFTAVGALQFGNTPRRLSDRTFGRVDFDGALQKSFNFGEGISFLFRAESENFINHVDLSAPGSLVLGSSTFGQITSAANNPRFIKLGGRLTF
jgi:hypothetical protein